MTTRADLLAHLADLAEVGHVAPCRIWPTAGWTSETPTEQRLAATLCAPCPALTPCRSYGLAQPDEHGVYGALVNTERHRTNLKEEI